MSRNDPPRSRNFESAGEVPRSQVPRSQVPRSQVPRSQVPRSQVPRSQVPRSQVPPSASVRPPRSPADPDLPVEVTAYVTRTTARRGAAAMLVVLVVLALLNAGALERYVANYSGSTVAEELLVRAGEWNAVMERIGFNEPRERLRAWVEEFRALRLGEAGGQ